MAQAEGFQDIEAGAHFLDRVGRQRDANSVANPGPQQRAHADRRFDRADAQATGLGDPQMQRIIAGLGQAMIRRDRQKHVRGFDADFDLVKIMVLQQAQMVEGAFHHRVRARLAVFLQQFAFQTAGIDANANGAAMVLGRLHHLAHPVGAADIAGIDAQARRTGTGRFEGALVMEMNIRDQGHPRLADNLFKGGGGLRVGAGHAHDVGAGVGGGVDLVKSRAGIGGDRVGHGLHRDRRVAANGEPAHMNLAGAATGDVTPGTDAHGVLSRLAAVAGADLGAGRVPLI